MCCRVLYRTLNFSADESHEETTLSWTLQKTIRKFGAFLLHNNQDHFSQYYKDANALQVTYWNTTKILVKCKCAPLPHIFSFLAGLFWLRADMRMSFKFNQLCNWIMIIQKWYCPLMLDDSGGLLSALRSSFWSTELLRLPVHLPWGDGWSLSCRYLKCVHWPLYLLWCPWCRQTDLCTPSTIRC